MHISIKFCLDFFITSRSIHVVLIGFQYIFVSFCILVYFVAFRILVYFVSLRFAFQYISLRNVSFRFDFVSQFSTTLIFNPFYIGPYEDYFCVCLGCHNLQLHYKRLSNLAFLVSREYNNTFFFVHCFILNVKLKINSLLKICEVNISKTIFTYTLLVSE